jgi:hypothetical protein
VFGDVVRARLGINVHSPGRTFLVPDFIHYEITRQQNNWWNEFLGRTENRGLREIGETGGRAAVYRAMSPQQLREYVRFADSLRSRYSALMIPGGGSLAHVNNLRRNLGLAEYVPGRRFTGVGSTSARRTFARGAMGRIFTMRNLQRLARGLTVVALATIAANLLNPSEELERRFNQFMRSYERALAHRGTLALGTPLEVALRHDCDSFLRELGLDDTSAALAMMGQLRFFAER